MNSNSQQVNTINGRIPLSIVEGFKQASNQLRGGIADALASESAHFEEADKQLLKFHGTYQQEDRDARKARRKEGIGKHFMFMVRCKIPGGRLTADQYLALDRLAGTHANGTLRLTTRQGIQFHGVLKDRLQETIAGINTSLLTTLGACGDVVRNVMACPAPHHHDHVQAELQDAAAQLAAHFAPRTRGYHEIWLNGERMPTSSQADEAEPLYAKTYLPRKFKIGLARPEDNCVDVYAQDLGLLALADCGHIAGYNVLVGGGMGMTHGNSATFARLAEPVAYVSADRLQAMAEAIVKLFRDHGNRGDRKRARLKYLLHDWGIDQFRQILSAYLPMPLEPPRELRVQGYDAHLGWHSQGDGRYFYGLSIENGRIKDDGQARLRSCLRTVIERLRPELRITPQQDLLLCGLGEPAKPQIEQWLEEFGVSRPEQVSPVRRHSMACPAIPTCGLALTESERALPGVLDQLELELKRLGLQGERLSVRMTGCPNGCARPYQSDIGIVGRSGDKYTLFVGGHVLGTRLNFMIRDLVPLGNIVATLVPILTRFRVQRHDQECFGDFCHRVGVSQLQSWLPAVADSGRASAPATATGPFNADCASLRQPLAN